jgi:hypothetical protein
MGEPVQGRSQISPGGIVYHSAIFAINPEISRHSGTGKRLSNQVKSTKIGWFQEPTYLNLSLRGFPRTDQAFINDGF